jgi:hypothetical protein
MYSLMFGRGWTDPKYYFTCTIVHHATNHR